VTSNPFIGREYARLIAAFLRDLSRRDNPSTPGVAEPINILELGGGSGRLAFHVLTALLDEMRSPEIAGFRIRYLLTDFSEATVRAWAAHPRLAPLIQRGVLALGIFDADRPDEVRNLDGEVILGTADRS
jgi:hypothetical protein